ncbi:MAG: alpha/beta fold hydrolase, partial [Acidimicrobiales bacterium]
LRSRRPFRLDDCADDVAALADVLGLGRFTAVGYSMGGPIAQLLWRRHPGLIDGMVLCATAQRFSREDLASQLYVAGLIGVSVASRLTPPFVRRSISEAMIQRRLHGLAMRDWAASELARNDPVAVLEAGIALRTFDSSPWVSTIDVPTGVVLTKKDQAVSPRRQLMLKEAITGATLHPVDGDHTVCVNDYKAFVPVLVEAVASVTDRARRMASSP